jgi:hypothetical protein
MTDKREPIKAKVAQIISTRSLVLNAGTEQGVTEDMIFAVLNRKGDHIIDPETKEDLGSLLLPKVRVRIAYVDKKFSMARTYRTIGTGSSISQFAIPSIFLQGGGGERVETLRTADHDAAEAELDEKDSIVKIGDPAIELIAESEKKAAPTPKESS